MLLTTIMNSCKSGLVSPACSYQRVKAGGSIKELNQETVSVGAAVTAESNGVRVKTWRLCGTLLYTYPAPGWPRLNRHNLRLRRPDHTSWHAGVLFLLLFPPETCVSPRDYTILDEH